MKIFHLKEHFKQFKTASKSTTAALWAVFATVEVDLHPDGSDFGHIRDCRRPKRISAFLRSAITGIFATVGIGENGNEYISEYSEKFLNSSRDVLVW